MAQTSYIPLIRVLDLEEGVTSYLNSLGFARRTLEEIDALQAERLIRRDKRESGREFGLRSVESWRTDEEYLLYQNAQETVAYVRPNPYAPLMPTAFPVEIHFAQKFSDGFTNGQYFSLAIPQRMLTLHKKALHESGYNSISSIAKQDENGPLSRLDDEMDFSTSEVPVYLFHSVSVSSKKPKLSQGDLTIEKVRADLSVGVGSVIIATELFARKQIAYYTAAQQVDELYS